jgi:hypothetical protein
MSSQLYFGRNTNAFHRYGGRFDTYNYQRRLDMANNEWTKDKLKGHLRRALRTWESYSHSSQITEGKAAFEGICTE